MTKKRDRDVWKVITPEMMTMEDYPCGVSAGDIIALRNDLHYQDHKGKPTGGGRVAGTQAQVLTGNPDDPTTVGGRWRCMER